MNQIQQLINQMCPNGVEWKTLGEVGTFFNGVTGKSKKDFENGNAKFISYMNVFSNPKLKIDVEDTILINKGEKQNTLQYGDVIFTTSSETSDESGMSSVLTIHTDEKIYLNSFCFGFRVNNLEKISPDFYSYIFRSEPLRNQIIKCANGVTRFNISKASFVKVKIPLPPLAIQTRIVEILDHFTNLTANLTAELNLRRKQFEHYREKLLSLDGVEGVENGILLDILKQPITDGPHETPTFVDEGIPFLSAEAVVNSKIDFNKMRGYISEEYNAICCKKYKPQMNDVYVVKSGSTVGKIAMVDFDSEFNIWSPLAALRVNEHNSPRYLYYLLLSDSIQNQIQLKCSKGSQPNLSMRVLEIFEVSIPPLATQHSIVSVLDKFTALIENIEKELALRQKQYEYYREELLRFGG